MDKNILFNFFIQEDLKNSQDFYYKQFTGCSKNFLKYKKKKRISKEK